MRCGKDSSGTCVGESELMSQVEHGARETLRAVLGFHSSVEETNEGVCTEK